MAKDGTNRGGARPGAGRKPKALSDKIKDGQKATAMMNPAELEGVEMPPIREYLTEVQRDGTELCAKEIYEDTYRWLKNMKCENFVSRQLLEQYAMTMARYIHCEQTISKLGYIAKHPTTGAAISSPYVKMSLDYNRQGTILGNEIQQIVKENCPQEVLNNPNEDVMEILLRTRKGT
ncbi:MAG: P27 family phage terminase small subunit [Lachnospiraceae bacterium]|nr:P27 family phage terminase small subunit [Lachnospiraceae bacterium]